MAAIDLERGLAHGGRGWGKERRDVVDNFDSEMQEWEDQLQDIQRKIEELYNEVQARRGGNSVTPDNHHNIIDGPGNLGDGIFTPAHQSNRHRSDGRSYPAGHQNGVSEIGDLLQDYLGHGKHANRKNNGARHVHFSDTIRVSQDFPVYQDESGRRAASQRAGHEQFLGSFEELENRKNRSAHAKGCPDQENTVAKPPLRQKEASSPRSTAQLVTAESPTTDRKSYGPGVLGDRKCGSPSVLRKFGAMLQENEGKTLTDAGVVTSEVKCLSPVCQRKTAAAAPGKTPLQKCTSEVERGGSESSRRQHKDLRGGSQTTAQVLGSPRTRSRSNSAADRDKLRKPASQHWEPNVDGRIQGVRPGGQPELTLCGRDDGLIELLDMLEIQHEYTSRTGYTTYKTTSQQVNASQWPPEPKTTFSRPARPANQRPPSRWASRTESVVIAAPSGPNYRPPSPLVRPPTPKTRTPSPALKHRPAVCYPRPAETVIM
ncbi:uncharacterized protein KIAA0408-like [Hippocampus zosterae]|uniref:uncharacterized protein KIAA0408-like n=1 Tax=Hippocampus zosterae TaxID=109293 RepID=UPI00223E05FD|nr:uncharacterized protein KIAA0408-like [Hippocampus zosterae]XP_051908859.1 uncharacterized protein KIAA0408-like [Hippocampus zosterae]